jgi:hypothetical protein
VREAWHPGHRTISLMPPTRPRLSRLATLCAATLLCACSEPVPMGSAVYRHDAKMPRCEPGSRPGRRWRRYPRSSPGNGVSMRPASTSPVSPTAAWPPTPSPFWPRRGERRRHRPQRRGRERQELGRVWNYLRRRSIAFGFGHISPSRQRCGAIETQCRFSTQNEQ